MANKSNLHYPHNQKSKSNRDFPKAVDEVKPLPVKKKVVKKKVNK